VNNGTLVNSPTFDSLNGGSMVFNGTTNLITLPQIRPTLLTLSVWFKATGIPTNNDASGGNLIVSSPQLFNGAVQYGLGYSWLNQRVVFNVQANTTILATSNNSVLRNTIYNIVGTYDGSNRRIYLNGQQVAIDVWTTNPVYPTSGVIGAQIGAWNYPGFTRFFNGNIYQASIYNRALSASEVLQNFNTNRARFGI
jgi:hypothetical protein